MTYYTQDISSAYSLLPDNVWQAHSRQASYALKNIQEYYHQQDVAFLHLPEDKASIAGIKLQAEKIINKDCEHLVLVGTGGSSLGAQTLSVLSNHKIDNNIPTLHVLDNTDPATAKRLYDSIDASKTMFLLVSKSGSTIEVLAHALIGIEFISDELGGDAVSEHFVVITEPKESPLTNLANNYGFEILNHNPDVGGRYSVLSLVGLLPAACLGIDIEAVCVGANSVMQELLNATTATESSPSIGAALQVAMAVQGYNTHVFMPYCDQLSRFGRWYQQLVAESLGKDGKGITPFTAQGAVHQHSLLQLFLDGQSDKWFTLISLEHKRQGKVIAENIAIDNQLEYLSNHAIGDIINSQQIGTAETLKRHNRPLREIKLGKSLEAETLGALMMHWMLETIISANIMRVNPYDQPAVEEGKIIAREYLNKW